MSRAFLAVLLTAWCLAACTAPGTLPDSELQDTEPQVSPPDPPPVLPPDPPPVLPPDPPPDEQPVVVEPGEGPMPHALPLPAGKRWVKVWSDEFDGTEVDLTKWIKGPEHWNRTERTHGGKRIQSRYEDDNLLFENGTLVLRNTRQIPPEDTDRFDGDALVLAATLRSQTRFYARYGYFEARINVAPLRDGIVTAFWLQATDYEIDVMESARAEDEYEIAIHDRSSNPTRSSRGTGSVLNMHSGYHVFAVYWYEDGYAFYADGNLMWHYSEEDGAPPEGTMVSSEEHYVIVSTGVTWRVGNAYTGTFPNQAMVDWVRVWEIQDAP